MPDDCNQNISHKINNPFQAHMRHFLYNKKKIKNNCNYSIINI